MSVLNRNKSMDNVVDARQAIHPCISNAPMFLLLALFSKVLLMCHMLVAKSYGLVRNLPPYKSHIHYPKYPPRNIYSSHALESSHRT